MNSRPNTLPNSSVRLPPWKRPRTFWGSIPQPSTGSAKSSPSKPLPVSLPDQHSRLSPPTARNYMERLPGFRDFYPEPLPHADLWSADARQYIFDGWRSMARRYGFREYDGPPLEPLELFTSKSGEEIVGQLYNFTDKGERVVALRPE